MLWHKKHEYHQYVTLLNWNIYQRNKNIVHNLFHHNSQYLYLCKKIKKRNGKERQWDRERHRGGERSAWKLKLKKHRPERKIRLQQHWKAYKELNLL